MNHLDRLFGLSVDMLCIADMEGYFKTLNPAFEQTLGYSSDELKQRPFIEFVHPDDKASTLQEMASLSAGAKTLFFENRYRCKDGSYKWLAWTGTPDPTQGLIFAVARDVTEAKEREAQLRQAEQALQKSIESEQQRILFLEGAPDAVIAIDQGGDIVLANTEAERLFGYDRSEMAGQHVNMLVPRELHAAHSQHLSAYFRNPTRRPMGVGMELAGRRKDGSEFPVEISLSSVDSGEKTFVAAAVRDVTQRKLMESQLYQAQKMEAVGQLTGGIAHDFNNLLTIVIGNLQLVQDAVTQDKALSESIEAALTAASRGAELTARLLAFSRRQLLTPRSVDINAFVRETESLLGRTLGANIEITMNLADDLWLSDVDTAQLENSLINLGINARDAMPDGGKLLIETANTHLDDTYAKRHAEVTPGPYVLLTISDSGTGIPRDLLPRIFEPFVTTKDFGKGSGLGLSMVYGFVKQSKGHINVYSEEGHGTTIKIYLPRSGPETKSADATPTHRALAVGGHETVLLVDDEPDVRRIAAAILKQLGYRVLEAASGAEALAVAEENETIDLLFTDLMMPGGISGAQLADKLRQRQPSLKVLITSGYGSTSVAADGLLQRHEKLLNKPYRRTELAHAVRGALDDD